MSGLFSAIAAIPSVLSAVEWFAEQVRLAKVKQEESVMAQALISAQASKDTSSIDKLFDPDKK